MISAPTSPATGPESPGSAPPGQRAPDRAALRASTVRGPAASHRTPSSYWHPTRPRTRPLGRGPRSPHWHTGLLPALAPDRWRESRRGATGWAGPCGGRRSTSPGSANGAGSSRPLFSKSPQGSRAAQPAQRENGRSLRRKGSAQNQSDVWCYPILPPVPEGPPRPRPPCTVRKRGPAAPPPRRPTDHSRGTQTPVPAACPQGQQGAEAERRAGGPQASPAPSTSLAFLTS